MKRHGNLWSEVIAFENLLRASRKAQRGKRFKKNVLDFNARREDELLLLHEQLKNRTYRPGGYHTFYITEPKKRLISAAPYRDRVVHHALCNVVEPLFERGFIRDSYANRAGFGSHRALRRFVKFVRQYRYILQCDIQKYFPNIDHAILKTLVRRKIKCPETLWLLDRIIDHSNPQQAPLLYFPGDDLLTPLERRKGLPVGNLTSQLLANVYLDGFDHFVKEHLKIRAYVRYVDDFALFGDDREELRAVRREIEAYLAGLRLRIHPVKSQLFETRRGPSFLGFRVLPNQIRVRNDNLRRARRRLRAMQAAYSAGQMPLAEVGNAVRAWLGHLAHGDTWRLREKILNGFPFG